MLIPFIKVPWLFLVAIFSSNYSLSYFMENLHFYLLQNIQKIENNYVFRVVVLRLVKHFKVNPVLIETNEDRTLKI